MQEFSPPIERISDKVRDFIGILKGKYNIDASIRSIKQTAYGYHCVIINLDTEKTFEFVGISSLTFLDRILNDFLAAIDITYDIIYDKGFESGFQAAAEQYE